MGALSFLTINAHLHTFDMTRDGFMLLDADEHKAHKLSENRGRPNIIVSEGVMNGHHDHASPENVVLPAIRKDGAFHAWRLCVPRIGCPIE
ncbi:hypothetical protein amb4046 [Paramagnetospirillum magneticum AMB-1]|uniref:Uncharacterized protein n=1 Tax=Paramagnetospirillum magneticum (strain ATCC 700264 / AMB-1) TaxID=342108 RepID=Q2VZX5_PARM1|nr:hypothetical protein amb4046 [Paramagnetospirillum magneticum AMB-1]